MNRGRVASVVRTTLLEDRSISLELDRLADVTILRQALRGQATPGSQYSPPDVNQLSLMVSLKSS